MSSGDDKVLEAFRRNYASAAEQQALTAEEAARFVEILADQYGDRGEVATQLDPSVEQADKLRKRANAIRAHAGLEDTPVIELWPAAGEELRAKRENARLALLQQHELLDHADVYEVDVDNQKYLVAQAEARLKAVEEIVKRVLPTDQQETEKVVDEMPSPPNRGDRRSRNKL